MSQTVPPMGGNAGQRTLAAIVFTDVVSFSARMHTDEVATLKLLQRDFAEMRRLCAEHEGQVLKTTGDGLMLTFTSAVQAVACALAMQRQFAEEAKGMDAGSALQHRIGIHLGDVLVQDQDVMGDGVNIAARLQSEAEPGGICISQTVYDVVKNKLEMQAVSLGARDLKNIAQAMPVYRLLLEAQELGVKGRPTPPSARRGKGPWIAAAAALAAVGALVLFLGRGGAPAKVTGAPAPQVPAAASPPAAPAAAPGDIAAGLSADYSAHQETNRELHRLYLDTYDFKGLVAALREKGEAPNAPKPLQAMLRSAEQVVRMQVWLQLALGRYNAKHPLLVHDLSGDPAKDRGVYLADDQRIVVLEDGVPRPRDLPDFKPAELGSVIVSALREAREPQRPAVVGARAFARFYGLTAMTEALAPMPPAVKAKQAT